MFWYCWPRVTPGAESDLEKHLPIPMNWRAAQTILNLIRTDWMFLNILFSVKAKRIRFGESSRGEKGREACFLSEQHPLEQHRTFNPAPHSHCCSPWTAESYTSGVDSPVTTASCKKPKSLSIPLNVKMRKSDKLTGLFLSHICMITEVRLNHSFSQCELIMRQAVIKMFAFIVFRVIRGRFIVHKRD